MSDYTDTLSKIAKQVVDAKNKSASRQENLKTPASMLSSFTRPATQASTSHQANLKTPTSIHSSFTRPATQPSASHQENLKTPASMLSSFANPATQASTSRQANPKTPASVQSSFASSLAYPETQTSTSRQENLKTNLATQLSAIEKTTANTETNTPTFEYAEYKPSDTVAQAVALLQQHLANKPGEYQSTWQTQLNDMLQQILNREKFSYDLNGDALYQQYKDQYTTQGKMAMMDTVGQATAMTGGYGNSYAQSAGQQAYQGYLQQLNDVIPELYQLALNQYNAEGDAMYDQASLMAQMEDQDYGRYRDQVSDYLAELSRLTDDARYQAEMDYGKWVDGRDFAYGQYSDDRAYEYQTGRDAVADAQWQAQFNEAKRQYDEQMVQSKSSSSSSSSNNGGKKGYDNGSRSKSEIIAMQKALGLNGDGKWGPNTQSKAKAKWGVTSADEAWELYQKSLNPEPATGFTGSTYGEATAYLKSKGISASGLMTQSEWQRHKNNNNSAGGEHEASSYQEYLAAYIYGKTK